MLSRNFRIGRELFTTLKISGVVIGRAGSDLLSLSAYQLPTDAGVGPKFSVVIGAKAIKLAHDRNRLRRRLRALFYKLLPQIKADSATIFWVKDKKLVKMERTELELEVNKLLQRSHLLK
jgi:ribonuclease P protein component